MSDVRHVNITSQEKKLYIIKQIKCEKLTVLVVAVIGLEGLIQKLEDIEV